MYRELRSTMGHWMKLPVTERRSVTPVPDTNSLIFSRKTSLSYSLPCTPAFTCPLFASSTERAATHIEVLLYPQVAIPQAARTQVISFSREKQFFHPPAPHRAGTRVLFPGHSLKFCPAMKLDVPRPYFGQVPFPNGIIRVGTGCFLLHIPQAISKQYC